MNVHFKITIKYLFLFLVLSIGCFAQKEVPELWGQHVHDEAKILQSETIDRLEKELKVYEDSTTNQIAILLVQSLEGDELEDYSIRVAEKWKLGRKDKDNGVLLLVAIDDHKMRIEVGEGLEGVLTDAQSNRIIRNEIAPNFRRGNYDAGVTAGVDGIIKSIGGEYKADDIGMDSSESLGEKIFMGIFVFGILGLFTAFAILSPGCMGWGLYAFLIPFYATFPWAIFGYPGGLITLCIYIILTPIAKLIVGRTKWGNKLKVDWRASRSSGGSSWSSGGSSWGGSSGSSGFSGGGGSFGGGGSSGSW